MLNFVRRKKRLALFRLKSCKLLIDNNQSLTNVTWVNKLQHLLLNDVIFEPCINCLRDNFRSLAESDPRFVFLLERDRFGMLSDYIITLCNLCKNSDNVFRKAIVPKAEEKSKEPAK